MKRWVLFLAFLVFPVSAPAMTPVPDSELAAVTGQAGVSINPGLTMDISIGTMAWGDADGLTDSPDPSQSGGYVGLSEFTMKNLVIRSRTDSTDTFNTYSTLFLKPITIDVATSGGTDGKLTGTTFVRFGLGALRISIDALSFNVSLFDRNDAAATDALDILREQKLGIVSMGSLSMHVNPLSYVDIFPHSTSGVSFDVNVTLDRLSANYLSWGDTDGLGSGISTAAGQTGMNWMDAGTTAGYVGLKNFQVGSTNSPAASANGVVQVDVVTTKGGIYSSLPSMRKP